MRAGLSAEARSYLLSPGGAVAGREAVTTVLGPWYGRLAKPAWQPPDWLFDPVHVAPVKGPGLHGPVTEPLQGQGVPAPVGSSQICVGPGPAHRSKAANSDI
jgi:hypothetical protein